MTPTETTDLTIIGDIIGSCIHAIRLVTQKHKGPFHEYFAYCWFLSDLVHILYINTY